MDAPRRNVYRDLRVGIGLVGVVAYGEAEFYRGPVGRNTVDSEFSIDGVTALPRVDIIYAHANMSADLIDAAIRNGAKGIVVAGVGDGNMTTPALDALAKAGLCPARTHRLAALRTMLSTGSIASIRRRTAASDHPSA